METEIGGMRIPDLAAFMLSQEKWETREVSLTADPADAGPNPVRAGVRMGPRIFPLSAVTAQEATS